MKFTEEKLDQVFIELLGEEKISYQPGQNINRANDEVLIKEDLRTFLQQQYQTDEITSSEIDAIVLKLERLPPTGASLPAMGCVMACLVAGYSITNYDGEKGLITIELIE